MSVKNITLQAEEPPTITVSSKTQQASPSDWSADDFITEWNTVFGQKVFDMPHMATRALHTTIGLILKDVNVHFKGSYTDLRDSSIVMQDSGTGKKPTIEFLEEVVECLGLEFRRRSTITSAGAVGTIVIEDVIDPETGCKQRQGIVVFGDLKNLDLITCSEADSILYSKIDSFGNDLLTNICDSQDPKNLISKKLANGEVKPFTSHTSFFLTTTIPSAVNPRWFEKGLFQRFGISIKRVNFDKYQEIRDSLITAVGEEVDLSSEIKQLAEALKSKNVPEKFEFAPEIRSGFLEKARLLDKTLTDLKNSAILNSLKSFTVRRDLKMITYACHHAWLDERSKLTIKDIDYAYEVSSESWRDVLNFVCRNASTTQSCPNAILSVMSDGKLRSIDEIREKLKGFSDENIRYSLSVLVKSRMLNHPQRTHYVKLDC